MEQLATPLVRPRWRRHHTLWLMLLAGWLLSYADRTITGPVITWLIKNDIGFLHSAGSPHALGGLVGSLFFAGYMLTQFPGGYLGDRFGHREMIAISLLWAGIATLVSGVISGLIAFVALRIITGLGEGVFYSNDRALIALHSPPRKVSLGMGVAITGLSLGLTAAVLAAPYLLKLGTSVFGIQEAWRMPFLLLGALTLVFAVAMIAYLRRLGGRLRLVGPTMRLLAVSAVFCLAVMAVFLVADRLGLPAWGVALAELLLAFVLIGVVYARKSTELEGVLGNRDLMLLCAAGVANLWNLWFFSFWSVAIVSDAAHTSFAMAALTAAFNAGAGILGFPAGGWLSDYAKRRGWGRRPMLIAFTVIQGSLVLVSGAHLQLAGSPSLVVTALLLFTSGLFFNALQPMAHALVSDVVTPQLRGSAFGLYNLIAEIGAVASPAISGSLFDATRSWASAVYLDGAIMLASALIYLLVRELPHAGRRVDTSVTASTTAEPS